MEKIMSSLTNRRIMITLFLAFSSGLPLALSGSTLQAWYTVAGVSIVAIGALTLVGLPYIYKFLWAPLLDRYVPPLLGRRRGWIAIMQFVIAITLIVIALQNPQIHPGFIAILALLLAFFSATQDIGIDAYRVEVLQPEERGLGASMLSIGYRLAMLVSGGLAMVMAGTMGWKNTYFIMAAIMLINMIITFFGPEPKLTTAPPQTLAKAIVEPFREFLTRKAAIAFLILIVIYKLTDAFALSMGTAFLIRGVGFSLIDVGAIYKTVGIIATLFGSLVGGLLMTRLGLFRSLLYFGILQAVSNLAFMALAMVGKNYNVMVSAIFIESFCSGLGTTAFVAFLMGLCDIRYTATQYAIFAALSAVGRVFIGPVAGVVIEHIGWAQFYLWACLIAIPSLMLLVWLRPEIDETEQQWLLVKQTHPS